MWGAAPSSVNGTERKQVKGNRSKGLISAARSQATGLISAARSQETFAEPLRISNCSINYQKE